MWDNASGPGMRMLQLAYDANCHSYAIEYSHVYLDVMNQDEDCMWQDGEPSTKCCSTGAQASSVSLSKTVLLPCWYHLDAQAAGVQWPCTSLLCPMWGCLQILPDILGGY